MYHHPYHSPNPRRDSLHAPLSDATVVIVGLGGAADTALDLMRAGVRKFRLFDPDELESGNLVRHACGSESIGTNKAVATKRLLERYLGESVPEISAVPLSVFDPLSQFETLAEGCDLIIVGTDTDASRRYCGDVATEKGIPAVFVSMFELGCGGEVFAQIPAEACYECLMRHQDRKEFLDAYAVSGRPADCSSSRDVRSMPGIGIDQRFLSAIASRKAVDILLRDKSHALPAIGPNWTVFSVSGIPDILERPLSSMQREIERHPECGCGRNRRTL